MKTYFEIISEANELDKLPLTNRKELDVLFNKLIKWDGEALDVSIQLSRERRKEEWHHLHDVRGMLSKKHAEVDLLLRKNEKQIQEENR